MLKTIEILKKAIQRVILPANPFISDFKVEKIGMVCKVTYFLGDDLIEMERIHKYEFEQLQSVIQDTHFLLEMIKPSRDFTLSVVFDYG